MSEAGGNRIVTAGQVRRHDLLGSTALYRVVSVQGQIVVVEVISAPGLAAGETFRLTRTAVLAMEVVPAEGRTARSSRPARATDAV